MLSAGVMIADTLLAVESLVTGVVTEAVPVEVSGITSARTRVGVISNPTATAPKRAVCVP
ncbi:hypothetical protein D9N16_10885 [Lactococcus raffinolactis]|nr:hypothetical protein [Lactococcus raffinolactis]